MIEWPFGETAGSVPPHFAGARAEDLFLLWLMRLPLDADVPPAAGRLLAASPDAARDTPLQRRMRLLLMQATRTKQAA